MIAVIGLGRVGLPLACLITNTGRKVIGIDIDQDKCDLINNGVSPYDDETYLSEMIAECGGTALVASSRYNAASYCTAYIVVVPVTLTPENQPDFSALESACRSVGRILCPDDLVVIETTVPVGTTETKVRGWLEDTSGLRLGDFYLAHSPERIMSGIAISRLLDFPKIVGGVDSASGLKAHHLYATFLPDVRLAPDSRHSEFSKIAEGCYRDANIALANELYMTAEAYGINYHTARALANHDYCHLHLPGVGVGGHCIPVYPHFLMSDPDIPRPCLISSARVLNDFMVEYWVQRLLVEIDWDPDVSVCIDGIGYRCDTGIITNSQPIRLYHALKDNGFSVGVYDRFHSQEEVESLGLRWLPVDQADVVFNPFTLVVNHAEDSVDEAVDNRC